LAPCLAPRNQRGHGPSGFGVNAQSCDFLSNGFLGFRTVFAINGAVIMPLPTQGALNIGQIWHLDCGGIGAGGGTQIGRGAGGDGRAHFFGGCNKGVF